MISFIASNFDYGVTVRLERVRSLLPRRKPELPVEPPPAHPSSSAIHQDPGDQVRAAGRMTTNAAAAYTTACPIWSMSLSGVG